MSLLGIFSGDKSSSTTKYETTNTYTDQSAQATEGGVAAGAGASVKIESLDPAVVKTAVETQRDTAGMALASNQNVAVRAIDTNAAVSQAALNTAAGLARINSDERRDVLNTTDTALQSQQGALNQLSGLANAALERSQTPDSQVTKTLLYVIGAVALLFGLMMFRRPSKA